MKKLFAILLSAMLLFTACAALAENQAGEEGPAEAEGMLSGGWAAAAGPAPTAGRRACGRRAGPPRASPPLPMR